MIDAWLKLCKKHDSSKYNIIFKYDPNSKCEDWKRIREIGNIFGKEKMWGDYRLNWFEYTIHCVFPYMLYGESGENIMVMMEDERLKPENQKLGAVNVSFSYFGRLCNWYDYQNPAGSNFNQIKYLIRRMTHVPPHLSKPIRGLNAFTFYTTSPAWLYAILDQKPNVPRTGRTNWACMFLVSFNYYDDALNLTAVFRNLYATHSFGDMMGLKMMLDAICKQIKVKAGKITIHAIHWEYDEGKKIKHIIQKGM